MSKRWWFAVAAGAALAGCATATPYQPAKSAQSLGYHEQRLESNRYQVSFTGNASTPKDKVDDYVLYRAAELTLDNGSDYFVVVDQAQDSDAKPAQGGSSPRFSFGIGSFGFGHSGFGTGIGVSTGSDAGTTTSDDNVQASADILIYKGAKPDGNPSAYDARQVKANLESNVAPRG